jgi:hypothetical protein
MMKKHIKKLISQLLVAGLLVGGLTTVVTTYAANEGTGADGAVQDKEYTLEEMLTYAIEDEYLAQTKYNLIMETYGVQRPFSNIIKAEDHHISSLTPFFEKYDVSIPQKDWESLVTIPESLDAAYSSGVEAEQKNIEMYESFLKEELPDEVKIVFEELMNASTHHLEAFQRQADRTSSESSKHAGNGNRMENGNNGTNQKGQDDIDTIQEDCIQIK